MPCYTTCNDTTTIWGHWTQGTASTCATNDTWGHWTNGYANTSSTAAITVNYTTSAWRAWAEVAAFGGDVPRSVMTEEQQKQHKAEYDTQAEEWAVAEAKRKKVEEEADKRAEELLVAHLDSEQKKQYRRDRSFFTHDRRGQRYHVRRGWSGHVDRVDPTGKVLERFCIHPREQVPLPDNQLLAKLMIETEPDAFRKTANVTRVAPEPVAA